MTTVGIAGAGLIGRLLALELATRGARVELFDRDRRDGTGACAYTAAGMLSPHVELAEAERAIASLGLRSLERWPTLLERLAPPVDFQRDGTLVVAHPRDRPDLERLERRFAARLTGAGHGNETAERTVMETVDGRRLAELEPGLVPTFERGLYFPHEGQVDPRQLLAALTETLPELGVEWHDGTPVAHVEAGVLHLESDDERRFEHAVDCRGLGARVDDPELRGVRGELLVLHAPEVELRRPLRLIHPRQSIYLCPRRDARVIVGATSIESDDRRPITVRSALELLSAAYSVHPGFSEASIVETRADCRPAYPDNLPRLRHRPGLLRINGLYRHGFLIGPELARLAADHLLGGTIDLEFAGLFERLEDRREREDEHPENDHRRRPDHERNSDPDHQRRADQDPGAELDRRSAAHSRL